MDRVLPAAEDATPLSAAATGCLRFVEHLEARSVRYCFVGPTAPFPARISGDLDIVVDPATLGQSVVDLVRDFATSAGMTILQHVWHATTAHAFVLAPDMRDGRAGFVKLDISTDAVVDGHRLLAASEIVEGRRRATDSSGNPRQLFIPDPAVEFVLYLGGKLKAGAIPDDKARHLSGLWNHAPDRAAKLLRRFWSEREAEGIARCAESGDWRWVRQNMTHLRRRLRAAPGRLTPLVWLAEGRRIWCRIVRPTGLHIVFLGTDGAGKTTVIAHTLNRIEPIFAGTARYYLFPGSPPGADKPLHNPPHALRNRGGFLATAKIGLWLCRYWAGYGRYILRQRLRSRAILFDRYYDDIFVDPRRYRYGGSMLLARAARKLIFSPDLYILLDAPAEIVWERKKEVSVEEARRQQGAYRALMSGVNNGAVVDAGQPIDDVVSDVSRVILQHMARRTEGRLGAIGWHRPGARSG